MKKKAVRRKSTGLVKVSSRGLRGLLDEVRALIRSARRTAATAVNTLQVLTNYEIGRRIVQHEQQGKTRAEYGKEILTSLARVLTAEFGNGFSLTNLKLMRQFFIEYSPRIGQSLTDQFARRPMGQSVTDQFDISQDSPARALQKPSRPFALSWTHYVCLLGVKNGDERSFYEIEARQCDWTVRELKRQLASGLFERLALSRDKDAVRRLARDGQIVVRPQDIFKEPYVLEFLGLDEQSAYSESDLETAIIDQLEHFLLELGKGFLFEARQKRFTFDEDHYFLDLVFYNRLLRAYVLVDLKLGKLTHQDLGQMQMYVNHYDRDVKLPDENPTIGIVLCKRKKQALVELTLPANANIHAREYQLYLPSKKLLRRKLLDWTRAAEAQR